MNLKELYTDVCIDKKGEIQISTSASQGGISFSAYTYIDKELAFVKDESGKIEELVLSKLIDLAVAKGAYGMSLSFTFNMDKSTVESTDFDIDEEDKEEIDLGILFLDLIS